MNAAAESIRARRYLLGLADEHEAADLEQQYLASDAAVERLTAVEDELIEEYLEDRLAAQERQQFEQSYLASARHRARVESVRQLRARAGRPAVTATPATRTATDAQRGVTTGFWWKPWLALAASVILVTGAAWLRTPAASGSGEVAVSAPPSQPETNVTTTPSPAAQFFALTLVPVGVRGATANAQPPALPEGTGTVRLILERDSATSHATPSRVVVRAVTGEERWTGAAQPLPAGGSAIAQADITTPLPADDYIVTLMARGADGMEREWLQYLLPLRRP